MAAYEIEESVAQAVAEAWSDPLDMRTDAELAAELDVSPAVLRALRRDEDFYAQVVDSFRRQLPQLLPEVLKSLIASARTRRNVASAKLLLEALGLIEGGGTKITVFQGGGGSGGSGFDFSRLSDMELDRTILAFQREAFPGDVEMMGGRVVPSWEYGAGVVDAVCEDVAEAEEGSAGERVAGETAEDGV